MLTQVITLYGMQLVTHRGETFNSTWFRRFQLPQNEECDDALAAKLSPKLTAPWTTTREVSWLPSNNRGLH